MNFTLGGKVVKIRSTGEFLVEDGWLKTVDAECKFAYMRGFLAEDGTMKFFEFKGMKGRSGGREFEIESGMGKGLENFEGEGFSVFLFNGFVSGKRVERRGNLWKLSRVEGTLSELAFSAESGELFEEGRFRFFGFRGTLGRVGFESERVEGSENEVQFQSLRFRFAGVYGSALSGRLENGSLYLRGVKTNGVIEGEFENLALGGELVDIWGEFSVVTGFKEVERK